jgi:TolA-binding protein
LLAEGQLGLAWASLDAKQWAAAEAAARGAVAAAAGSKQADLPGWSKLALAEALINGGKPKEATPLLATLEASSVADIASQANYDAAQALEAQNMWEAAAARWEKYSSLAPEGDARARAYLRQGLALVKAKKTGEATAAFDRATAADAKGEVGARALYESAWLAHDAKHADETARWQKLESNYPASKYAAEAVLQQGELHFDAKAWLEATAAYRRVTERYPQSDIVATAWYKLASAEYNQNHWNEAAAAFEKAAAYPKSDVALESSFWTAESLRRAGKIAESRARYESFLKTANGTTAPGEIKELVPTAQLGLGQALLANGDAMGAAEAFRAAATGKGSTAVEANFGLAEALAKQNKNRDAATQYLKVATLYPNTAWTPRAQWEAARNLEQSGDKQTAVELLKVLSQRQPADEWSAKAQEQLKVWGG